MTRTLAATSAAVTVTAAVGGLATGRQTPAQSAWFRRLRTPPFQPPPVVFPVVWTALYATIAGSAAATIDALPADEARAYEAALAANLALNAGWTWTFFRARQPVLATAHSAVLAASTADLVRRSSGRARAALVPYAAWTAFATVLSGTIAWLNRDR